MLNDARTHKSDPQLFRSCNEAIDQNIKHAASHILSLTILA